MLVNRFERDHHPGVLCKPSPASKAHTRVRLECTAHIGEGRSRIAKEHDAEAREQQIGHTFGKAICRSVALHEFDIAASLNRLTALTRIGADTSSAKTSPLGPTA
jgi:hypothetical protein